MGQETEKKQYYYYQTKTDGQCVPGLQFEFRSGANLSARLALYDLINTTNCLRRRRCTYRPIDKSNGSSLKVLLVIYDAARISLGNVSSTIQAMVEGTGCKQVRIWESFSHFLRPNVGCVRVVNLTCDDPSQEGAANGRDRGVTWPEITV